MHCIVYTAELGAAVIAAGRHAFDAIYLLVSSGTCMYLLFCIEGMSYGMCVCVCVCVCV